MSRELLLNLLELSESTQGRTSLEEGCKHAWVQTSLKKAWLQPIDGGEVCWVSRARSSPQPPGKQKITRLPPPIKTHTHTQSQGWRAGLQTKSEWLHTHKVGAHSVVGSHIKGVTWSGLRLQGQDLACSCGSVPPGVSRHTCTNDQLDSWSKKSKA